MAVLDWVLDSDTPRSAVRFGRAPYDRDRRTAPDPSNCWKSIAKKMILALIEANLTEQEDKGGGLGSLRE